MLDGGPDGGVARARRGAWVLGAILLFALGLGFAAAPLIGSGGWILLALAIPPLAVGAGAFGRVRAVRVVAPLVALAYAVVVGEVATTSLRGLTPPPSATVPSIDPLAALVAVAFLGAAILLALGTPDAWGGRVDMPRRRALVALAAVVVLVGFVLDDLNSTVAIEWYRVIDQRTIAVTVGVAPRSWTRITDVRETATDVTVKVETFTFPQLGPETAEMALHELRAQLTAPLGDRVVRDAFGQVVRRNETAPTR